MTETPSTKDQAQQAACTAADEGRHVAGVAADEAKSVAAEAKGHAQGLLDEALGQVDDQTRSQRDRAASTLQSFGDDLDTMASQGGTSGLAAELARQAASQARTLGNHLDGREPQDLLNDVRRFARQRPGVFLLGALAAGVVAGRLARGARDLQKDPSLQANTTETPVPTAAPPTPPTASHAAGPGGLGAAPSPYNAGTVSTPAHGSADPLGLDDPSLGATVPPNPTRYEP